MSEKDLQRQMYCEHTYCGNGACYLKWTYNNNIDALPGLVKDVRFKEGCRSIAKYLSIVSRMEEKKRKQIKFRIILPF